MPVRFVQGFIFFSGLLVFVALFLPASVWVRFEPVDSIEPFSSSILQMLFILLAAALVFAALLLAVGLRLWESEGRRFTAVLFLTLSLLLLVKSLHNAYQTMLWDKTTDSLGVICLAGPLSAVILVGIVLIFTLPGKMKLAGLVFSLVVPLALIVVAALARDVDIKALPEGSAERISRALDLYRQENGRYPQRLDQLEPRYLLFIPEPGIIFAQDWCYEGGAAGYALGYVNRDHWSDPRLYGRVWAIGDRIGVPGNEVCAAEIAGLLARGPGYYEVREDVGAVDAVE
jgi:hypothetical protein